MHKIKEHLCAKSAGSAGEKITLNFSRRSRRFRRKSAEIPAELN